jgi:CubicO group peptidase (beta-lactamase class C family)
LRRAFRTWRTDFLARVLEVVSGRPFEQILSERVLGPAGMAQTGFSAADLALDRLAMVHEGGRAGRPITGDPNRGRRAAPGRLAAPAGRLLVLMVQG